MITGLAGRPSRDAAATPYSEEGAVGYPMAYRTLTLICKIRLVSSAASPLCPKRHRRRRSGVGLNHTQAVITVAYHRVRRILLRLRA